MATPLPAETLGAATEAAIAALFARSVTVTATAVAAMLGVDDKTLRSMREKGLIAAVRIGDGVGAWRYTEADVRAFLAGRTKAATAAKEKSGCRSINRKNRSFGSTTSRSTVVDFTAQRAKRTGAPPKR